MAAELHMLATAVEAPGVESVLITERADIDRVRDLMLAGNTAQMADGEFMCELRQWLRYDPHYAMRSGDGLFSVASGNPSLPSPAGPLLFDRMVAVHSENDHYARQQRSSPGVAIFSGCIGRSSALGACWASWPAFRAPVDRARAQMRLRQSTGRSARVAFRTGFPERRVGAATGHRDPLRPWSCFAVLDASTGFHSLSGNPAQSAYARNTELRSFRPSMPFERRGTKIECFQSRR
ncbi:hypothetical protein [Sphingomonas sp. PAMC 26621]|uniref:hypothetical protein n=1 Tax=Sphingomonas sp. PAMC 26621 TaxID=1112213 RepID=UPI00187D97E8|nr:hypothetical protein [Sphingomonas sp. PAMC 26621]